MIAHLLRCFAVLLCLTVSSCATSPHLPQFESSIYEVPTDQLSNPPIGRWAAVYTKSFSEKHNLPAANISTDLSSGVDYMEMQVLPFGPKKVIGCFLNMLVKKPNDLSFISESNRYQFSDFNKGRPLTEFITQSMPQDLHRIESFEFGTAKVKRGLINYGFSESALAFYSPSYLQGYDYISVHLYCPSMSRYRYMARDFAVRYKNADIWGKFSLKIKNPSDTQMPKGNSYFESFGIVPIPYPLTKKIFEGVF